MYNVGRYVKKYPDLDTFSGDHIGDFVYRWGWGCSKAYFLVFYHWNLKNKNVTGGPGLRPLFFRSEHKSTDPAFYIV